VQTRDFTRGRNANIDQYLRTFEMLACSCGIWTCGTSSRSNTAPTNIQHRVLAPVGVYSLPFSVFFAIEHVVSYNKSDRIRLESFTSIRPS